MIDAIPWLEVAKVIGGVIGGLIVAIKGRSWAINRTSKDAVALAADRAEVGMIERMQIELAALRQNADAYARERNDALAKTGRLEAENEMLREQLMEAGRRINVMEGELREVRSLLNSALDRHGKD